jgi:hypothetical protein
LIQTPGDSTDLFSTTGFSIFGVVKPISSTNSATDYQGDPIIIDAQQYFGALINDVPTAYGHVFGSSASYDPAQSIVMGTAFTFHTRWASTTIGTSVNGAPETTATTVGSPSVGNIVYLGWNAGVHFANVGIAILGLYNGRVSDATVTLWETYLRHEYATW